MVFESIYYWFGCLICTVLLFKYKYMYLCYWVYLLANLYIAGMPEIAAPDTGPGTILMMAVSIFPFSTSLVTALHPGSSIIAILLGFKFSRF